MSERFSRTRDIAAVRKPHRCSQCRKTIEAGSPALYQAGSGPCGFYSCYTCQPCAMPLTLQLREMPV